MSTPAILLSILAAWWLLLGAAVLRNHIQQLRAPKMALRLQKLEESREFETSRPMHPSWLRDHVIAPPLTIALTAFLFPLYLYGWFLERSESEPVKDN